MNTLLERAGKVPSTSAGKGKEKKHLVKVLMNSNYPLRFIKSSDTHHKANHRVSTATLRMKYKLRLLFYPM